MNDSTWAWMSGDNTCNQPGIYGEKGNASTNNVPGSRSNAVGWFDSSRQEFWFFGGYVYDYEYELDTCTIFCVLRAK